MGRVLIANMFPEWAVVMKVFKVQSFIIGKRDKLLVDGYLEGSVYMMSFELFKSIFSEVVEKVFQDE